MSFPAGPWMRVVIWSENNEKIWENEVWYKVSGTISPSTNIDTVANAVQTSLQAPLVATYNSEAAVTGFDVYLNNGTQTVKGATYNYVYGSLSGGAIPTENAVLVTLNAGIGTREGVGRLFLGGVDASNVDESRLTTSARTLYTAFNTALKGVVSPGGVTTALAMWSRKAAAIEVVSFTEVVSLLGHRSKRKPRR